MHDDSSEGAGLPVSPSIAPSLESVRAPIQTPPVSLRLLSISGLAILLGIAGGIIAKVLIALIGLITNVLFYGDFSFQMVPVRPGTVSPWAIAIPVAGALVVGVMARYGSAAIRGHGIPEVMERVLHAQSRISPKVMFLKPLSAAVAIGTGGPFGAEGPIIATGGALGSVVGQALRITADERKTLLAAGAAAGMAATFGTPVAAVLLAIELLLFEYRARSIVPVALASASATAVRMILFGTGPVFPMPGVGEPSWEALATYVVLGAVAGLASVGITRAVYLVEHSFGHLPLHWMWWPALGAIPVGIIGYIEPRTFGVGYVYIDEILAGTLAGTTLLILVVLKFVSWTVYLGSGTSGGTLAPLFIMGGGLGALLGSVVTHFAPDLGVNPAVAALVGMAAVFAGASHALLTSIVFAFEATRQPLGLLPLLAGCSAAYMISILLMRTSIMTEKLARYGPAVRTEYSMDFMGQLIVKDVMSHAVSTLCESDTIQQVRDWLISRVDGSGHQAFPVLDERGALVGMVTRRDVMETDRPTEESIHDLVRRPPVVAFETNTLREAADHMVREGVGRLPVLDRETGQIVGIVSRSDLLSAHKWRLRAEGERGRTRRHPLSALPEVPPSAQR